jgi:hypothetical protein
MPVHLCFKIFNMASKHQIVIVGGGNGGITVAAQLLRKNKSLDIAIIDPSDSHYYQPAWTMVGGGFYDINDTVRPEASVIPAGVTWIKEAVTILLSVYKNQKVEGPFLPVRTHLLNVAALRKKSCISQPTILKRIICQRLYRLSFGREVLNYLAPKNLKMR